jgi:hypothetical protein
MRSRSRRLVVVSAAALVLAAAAASSAAAAGVDVGLAGGVPSVVGSQHPFIAPESRPSEVRERPTDENDPNRNGYTVPEAPRSPACGDHFCVHWVAEGLDAPSLADANDDGIPDFVETVREIAEHVHTIENGKLGWREPKSDGRRGGGGKGRTDVYLSQLGGALFGYAAPDRGQGEKGRIPRRLYGYLVLDNDYSPFEFPGTKPIDDLEVTLAHEYNHILQFGYDAFQDPWFAEATATWMEDQVYNEIDDYFRYVRRWGKLYDTPLTASSIKEYGSVVWNNWLTHRYGRALLRRAWAEAIHVRPGGFSVGAYDAVIRAAGRSDFNRDFARFVTAVPEWRTGEGFRESQRYPTVPRQGRLPLNGTTRTRLLNHTTFQLLRVRARGGRAVVVHVTAPAGIAAGVALVGRIGSERQGRAVRVLNFKRHGGRLTVRLSDPGRFSRITAVLVNADTSAGGFSARRLDWLYLTDGMPFEVSGEILR